MFACAVLLLAALPSPLSVSIDDKLTLVHGVLTAPQAGDLTQAAKTFVEVRGAELGLPAGGTLGTPKTHGTRFGGSVQLPQMAGGLEVYGASAVVTFDGEGRVVRVASSLEPYRRLINAWRVSGPDAHALAAKNVEGALIKPDGAPYGGIKRMLFIVGEEAHVGYLAWVPTLTANENWHLAIDATNGALLWSENRTYASTAAKVYDPNPERGLQSTPMTSTTLNHLVNDGGVGFLTGARVQTVNCCPTANCDKTAGAPTKRSTGQYQTNQGIYTYDVAICDRRQLASNDPAVHASGDYVYQPVDPPTGTRPNNQSAADSDEFAEVQAYHHVDKAYDRLDALSRGPLSSRGFAPFQLRDNRAGRTSGVWVNGSETDTSTAVRTATGLVANDLRRVDNAAFMPREAMDTSTTPDNAFPTDALLIYQGSGADFAYDGPVLWHEFGHGMVYSTANWVQTLSIDARSASSESQALHEAMGDIVAFMVGNTSAIGTYIAPRVGTGQALRDAQNTLRCPDVLWGESHQDSQHFTGAIWEARQTKFQGTDRGDTFDAAFYAAAVSFPQNVDFAKAAAIVSAAVAQAFPAMPDAEAQMNAIFDARGVTNCSKVVDLTENPNPRAYYMVFGTGSTNLQTDALPGPYQMKLSAPKGAKRLNVRSQIAQFGNNVSVRILTKTGAPVTYTRNGFSLTNDADSTVTPTVSQGVMTADIEVQVPCGGAVYFSIANAGSRERQLGNITASIEPADTCPEPLDAGVTGQPDAGVVTLEPVTLDSTADTLGAPMAGCGCNGGAAGALGWLLVVVALRGRRSR